MTPAAIFERTGDRFLPTEAAVGPWDPGALHGGPVTMLLARAVEAIPSPEPMDVVRLTVELLRPVPVAPLDVAAELERPGRRVQLVGATVTSEGVEVARGRALRIRRADLGVATEPPPAPPLPAAVPPPPDWSGHAAYHVLAVEMRFVRGGSAWREPGPASAWVRLKLPVVAGEEPSPLERVAAAADFGNGLSGVLDPYQHLYINPDLTIHLQRPPEGEWICVDARTEIGPGYGLAQSALYDARGEVGRSLQSLFVEAR